VPRPTGHDELHNYLAKMIMTEKKSEEKEYTVKDVKGLVDMRILNNKDELVT